jgi:type II restriction/modification system DNA methylase subunit YeeA
MSLMFSGVTMLFFYHHYLQMYVSIFIIYVVITILKSIYWYFKLVFIMTMVKIFKKYINMFQASFHNVNDTLILFIYLINMLISNT